MANTSEVHAIDGRTLIGVLANDGRGIINGDRITVQYIDNIDTPRERVVEEFTAKVFYDSVYATFFHLREEPPAHYDDRVGFFNERAMRFIILDR